MPTPTIEELWQALRHAGTGPRQRRVDATHPFDIYVDFEHPARPGLVVVCPARPPAFRPMRAFSVEAGMRADGRWSLRLSLVEPGLIPVFAALCRDIVAFTRAGVEEAQVGAAILGRVERWRTLMEKDVTGLGETALRGLIGELVVLERDVLAILPAAEAVAAWTGPMGAPQDFVLPSGRRIEVKAVRPDAREVRINGLGQLDPGADAMILAVVRLEDTGQQAAGAVTAPALIHRLRERIAAEPETLAAFDASLAFAGWHQHPAHDRIVVRVAAIDRHDVGPAFPRLLRASVPAGIEDADYTITLPLRGAIAGGGRP